MTRGILNPRDFGEDKLPFFIPARVKLFMRLHQEVKNSHRLTRKPMPAELKAEYIAKSKEFMAYKYVEQ